MSQKSSSQAQENEKAKLHRRIAELEDQVRRLQSRDLIDGPLSAREALLVEAERIAHLGSWILNLETMEVKWSEELFRILGFHPEKDAATSEKFFNALHPEDRPRSQVVMKRLAEEGVITPVEYRVVRQDGAIREILTDGKVVRDSGGKVVRVVGTVLDVTDARRAERERNLLEEQLRQSQKMEVVGRVAGGVAHDFNNLLTVISGNSDLLLEQYPDDKLRRIRDAAEVGAAVTRQLLAFSRQTAAKPIPLDLNQVARDTSKIIERLVGEDVAMRLQLEAQPATIFADRGQVQQILLNLAVNARDAMPRGGELLITTSRAAGKPEKGWVRLTVNDSGTGMDEATRIRACEPFFTTKEPGQGTGLGLSTVERIVGEAGGEIAIESEPGRGTRVRIDFPLHAGAPAGPAAPAQGPGGTESILLVEDNAPLRELVGSFLSGAGYRVQSVGRPGEAEALWEKEGDRIDLLVTDMVMPEKSGRALARALSEKKPSLKTLFISGYAPRDSVHVPYLQKPFTRGELLHAVRAVCEGRASGNGNGSATHGK